MDSWEEHLEALGSAILRAVSSEDWNHVQRFGPNTGGFSQPAVCYMIPSTYEGIGELAEYLALTFPWFFATLTFYRTELFDVADAERR